MQVLIKVTPFSELGILSKLVITPKIIIPKQALS